MKISFEGTLSEYQALFGSKSYQEKELLGLPPMLDLDLPSLPQPESASVEPPAIALPTLSDAERSGALAVFSDFCHRWVEGFEDVGADQPPRLEMMQTLGQGRWPRPILIMAYEEKSLQRLVWKALKGDIPLGTEEERDWVDRVAATMVQISQMGFPDLQGTYDYSTQWRRN